MELALSLGDTPKPFSFIEKSQKIIGKDLGFCMAVDNNNNNKVSPVDGDINGGDKEPGSSSSDPPVQLDLLPFSPVHKTHPSSNNSPFTWLNDKCGESAKPGLEMNRRRSGDHEELSSPSTTVSSFQMDFSIFGSTRKRDMDQITGGAVNNNNNNYSNGENEGGGERGSDEEENGSSMGRKKLRLSKQQSAFLEESFKEHNTLNPKQKLALAKQLNLRPRQVEVWFQNRRARTKLKQTEVDCEYLKKCCETLTEENRRLQKELQELRALKASQPFYMQRPATTLTMCPSCERVATGTNAAAVGSSNKPSSKHLSLSPSGSQQPGS